MEKALAAIHADAGRALGEIALALAARRGVTKGRLREWAGLLRRAAEALEELGK